ncbi:TniQ family protein [Aldersonia kunmingensis]|uniref:TniQ family protein n=1 Tax=Aldersonia kunmingensis TaxID=408066 RepID=UPI0009FC0301|nr:TniQ family protein [Aldersonia kunmingensis]
MIPIVVDPMEGESLDSWLEYVADLNHCRPTTISGRVNRGVGGRACMTRAVSNEVLERLALQTGVASRILERCTTRIYRPFGNHPPLHWTRETGTWFVRTDSGYCPACLREDNLRWQLSWHVRWSSVCLRHLSMLRDRCPHCGGRLRATSLAHPRRTSSPRANTRTHCRFGCSTEALAEADAWPAGENTAAVLGQRWIDNLIADGGAICGYTQGRRLSAQTIFADLAVLTEHALHAQIRMSKTDARQQAHETAEPGPPSRWPDSRTSIAFLKAREMALALLHEPDGDHQWLTQDRLAEIMERNGRGKKLPVSAPLRRALGLHSYLPTHVGSRARRDATGRLRTHNAASQVEFLVWAPIDQMSLPASLWPTVRAHAPKLPPRVERTFAISAPILLAGLGRRAAWSKLAQEFGLDAGEPTVRRMIAHLITNENGSDALDYLLEVHAHLRVNPPPIDYRRRRRLFPTPAGIAGNRHRALARSAEEYLSGAFRWKIDRYIWQLLTGNDPLITTNAQLLHGPAAYSYGKFVHNMPDPLRTHAGEVAQRLLLRHRIGEPLTYQPEWDGEQHRWLPGSPCADYLPDTGRDNLRKSSLSLASAASTAGDPEELVHLALAGEATLARRLARFIDTADLADLKSAADAVGVQPYQIEIERGHLEDCLGDDLYAAKDPLALSKAGRTLRDLAQSHSDQLREIGECVPGRRSSTDSPPTASLETRKPRKNRRPYRATATGMPEHCSRIPDSLPVNSITALLREHPVLRAAEVRRLFGVGASAPTALLELGTIIGFEIGGAFYFPAFQFDTRTRTVRAVVAEINERTVPEIGRRAVAHWWLTTQIAEAGGRSPADLAIEGSHDDILRTSYPRPSSGSGEPRRPCHLAQSGKHTSTVGASRETRG